MSYQVSQDQKALFICCASLKLADPFCENVHEHAQSFWDYFEPLLILPK